MGVKMSLQKLADKIRMRRCELGMSLSEVARKIPVNLSLLSKIESAKISYLPSGSVLKRIAIILELDYDELMFLRGSVPDSFSSLFDEHASELLELLRHFKDNPHHIRVALCKLRYNDTAGGDRNPTVCPE